jgi:hypothetical protein
VKQARQKNMHGMGCVPLYGNLKKEKKRRPERRSLGTGKGEGRRREGRRRVDGHEQYTMFKCMEISQ